MSNNGKKFTTTITRENWEKKVEHAKAKGYFWEYKSMIKHWNDRIPSLEIPCPGVFLVGTEIHRVVVIEVLTSKTEYIPVECEKYVKTDHCYILKCTIPDIALKRGSTAASWDEGIKVPENVPIENTYIEPKL